MKYIASTIVRASDIGLNNYLFGGILLRWLDEYGALFVYKYLHHTFVTYKMQKTYFLKPAKQGQCIDFYVTNLKFDKISVNFDLVAKIGNRQVINTNMTFVAIDGTEINTNPKTIRLNPFLFQLQQFEKCIKQKMYNFMSKDEHIFHNVKHIEDMLNQLNMYKINIGSQNYKKLFIAICYHDSIHKAGQLNNEQKSIQLLKRDWGKIFQHEDVEYLEQLILCTKTNYNYNMIKQVPYSDLLHDLDMISFIDYQTMKSNDVKIRNEYAQFGTLQFYIHKLNYFNELIKKGVFISKFYSKYNATAKLNIENYIIQIKQLIENLKDNKPQENI